MLLTKEKSRKEEFENVFLPTMDSLYNLALRMTRNTNDAEDLVQETYLKAFRFFDNFKQGTNAKAWIFTIMANTFKTRYRKKQKEPVKINFDDVVNVMADNENGVSNVPANKSEARTSEDITEFLKTCVSDDVIDAIESVPEPFRIAVLLSDVEQFNYQEISEIIGASIGTIKSRIFRGRKILQKKLFEFASIRGLCSAN
jgi:RNA polymerase sigma-70 factor (ECF subfamily)